MRVVLGMLTLSAASLTEALIFPSRVELARSNVVMMGGRKATPLGRTTTKDGKQKKMDEIGPILENKMLIFAVPVKGLKMKTLTAFRNKLPATSVARVVKNTLMERACAEEWSPVENLLTNENLWVFVPESDIRPVLATYAAWYKEFKLEETSAIKGGVMEGTMINGPSVKALEKLPTKIELIAKVASLISNAGVKTIAIRLKAPGEKLARVLQMTYADAEKNPAASA